MPTDTELINTNHPMRLTEAGARRIGCPDLAGATVLVDIERTEFGLFARNIYASYGGARIAGMLQIGGKSAGLAELTK